MPCDYCGAQPEERKTSRYASGFFGNGLDRVDNKRGYERGNVVACCKACNIVKHNMTRDEFLHWVARVYRYSVAR